MRLGLHIALAGLVLSAMPAWADHPRSADEIVAEVRRATEPYQDIARARADGFVHVSGVEARHGYHFMNLNPPVLTAAGLPPRAQRDRAGVCAGHPSRRRRRAAPRCRAHRVGVVAAATLSLVGGLVDRLRRLRALPDSHV